MAHKQPELVERIVSRLEKTNHYIYIHYDAKSNDWDKIIDIKSNYRNVILVERKAIMWGGFSWTECEINNLKAMLCSENDYDYFHIISGQDYPCVDMDSFDSYFEANKGKSFVKLDSIEETEEYRKSKFKYRLENYFVNDYFHDKAIVGIPLYRVVNRAIRFIPRPYKDMNSVWGGWNWMSLERSVLRYVILYLNDNGAFYRRFKWTICSDELIFATILQPVAKTMNIEVSNSLRFVEWNPKRETNHLPLLLTETEYEDIINSRAFFCRKVQLPESERLLSLLDDHINNMSGRV